jgi:dipeptidyl aminopeptidase/acylaminoacyl peptidase
MGGMVSGSVRARPLLVEDAVQRVKIVGQPVLSPDGKRSLLLTRQGDLERNTVRYRLHLYESGQFKEVAQLQSSSNLPAIEDVVWLPDSRRVAFLGENPAEKHQVFLLDTETRVLRPLSDSPHPVVAYAINAEGSQVACVSKPPPRQIFPDPKKGIIATDLSLVEILRGHSLDWDYGSAHLELRVQGQPIKVADRLVVKNGNYLKFSPDGRYLLFDTQVIDVPASWNGYQDPIMQAKLKEHRGPGQPAAIWRCYLYDLQERSITPLMDAPHEGGREVLWAPDSRSLVLTGAYAPLDRDRKEREKGPFHFEYRLKDGAIVPLPQIRGKLLDWQGERLRFRKVDGGEVLLRRQHGEWQEDSQGSVLSAGLLQVRESIQAPPTVWCGDQRVFESNPQLADVELGRVEEIEWTSKDGRIWRGGLYYPSPLQEGKRYPLVIQTHGWNAQKFCPEGLEATAMAAQALACSGFVVAQVPDTPDEVCLSVQEGPTAMHGLESLIDHLDNRGLVDPKRVGLVGFSRTCFDVKYTLSHSTYPIAAAVVAEGIDAGYFQYLSYLNGEFEAMNGGLPLGPSRQAWLENSPGFNLEKNQAALLIQSGERFGALDEWEWLSGLRRLKKPVEFLLFEGGSHPLVQPWQVQASQQATVDWMRFWLLGERDPHPAKSSQYQRWLRMQPRSREAK